MISIMISQLLEIPIVCDTIQEIDYPTLPAPRSFNSVQPTSQHPALMRTTNLEGMICISKQPVADMQSEGRIYTVMSLVQDMRLEGMIYS